MGKVNKAFYVALVCLWSIFSSHAQDINYEVTSISPEPLRKPWALTSLPDGRWLITEREGNVVVLGGKEGLLRLPVPLDNLYVAGQGGLLDIALTQDFALSGRVLLTFSEGTSQRNHLAVASARFTNDTLSDVRVIFRVAPDKDTPVHYGGRLAVLDDGTWLVTVGDGFDYREHAQRPDSQLGKVLRLREDGAAPQDNPMPTAPYVFTLGHRNPQGLLVDENTKKIYLHEHGPDGGDEINLLEAGRNYGWPVVTLGLDYSGARISPFTEYEGMAAPLFNWSPSVAPSAMILYENNAFEALTGTLLITTLKAKSLISVNIKSSKPTQTEPFPTIQTRLRDIATDKQGNIYLLSDGDDAALLQIKPK